MSPEIKRVYLDSNFLVEWFINKEVSYRKGARLLMARLIANKSRMFASGLVFDECWNSIRKEMDSKRAAWDEKIYFELTRFTNKVLEKAEIVEFKNKENGVKKPLANIQEFKLRPRDAFHLAIMMDNKINTIITNDDDFSLWKKSGGEVVSF